MPEVVLLAGPGESSEIVARQLEARFGPVAVLEERKVSARQLLTRRARRLGWWPVLGQALFQALCVPWLRRAGAARREAILAPLRAGPLPSVTQVESVNVEEARLWLRQQQPRVVVVNGTRILGRETLGCVAAPFLNMHMGITPAYRGSHGGYWALAEGRPDLVGTTVHRVDPGIDTGQILGQAFFQPGPDDNFTTYPALHLAAGLPLLLAAVERELAGGEHPPMTPPDARSVLRHHPTLWGYLLKGVR